MGNAMLTVDLSALARNYHTLRQRHAKKNIAAVVKANAYGLGMAEVSRALAAEGCQLFFAATLEEAVELRAALPNVRIAAFNGMHPSEEAEYQAHRIMPVVNSLEQALRVRDWSGVMLHLDTGMTRLGLTEQELERLLEMAGAAPPRPWLLLSHLACANDLEHPQNAQQLARLERMRRCFPGVPVSFANSAGHFLPESYHVDIGRPGCALYGIHPTAGANPMEPVVTLAAPILQIRTLDRDEDVGYGATAHAKRGDRIAVVALGYADGVFRSLGNRGHAYISGHRVPMLGRVSMDMITLDVSAVPAQMFDSPTIVAEFINQQQTVDDIARACDTIGYEILTRIGRRVKRRYL